MCTWSKTPEDRFSHDVAHLRCPNFLLYVLFQLYGSVVAKEPTTVSKVS